MRLSSTSSHHSYIAGVRKRLVSVESEEPVRRDLYTPGWTPGYDFASFIHGATAELMISDAGSSHATKPAKKIWDDVDHGAVAKMLSYLCPLYF